MVTANHSKFKEITDDFREWNGWGPPSSEYQIEEYCRCKTYSLKESEFAAKVLIEWMASVGQN